MVTFSHVKYMQHPGLTCKRRAATCRLIYRIVESCKLLQARPGRQERHQTRAGLELQLTNQVDSSYNRADSAHRAGWQLLPTEVYKLQSHVWYNEKEGALGYQQRAT